MQVSNPASEGASKMAIESINPATGQLLKSFEPLSDSEIEKKLQRAADTFLSYKHIPFATRAEKLVRAAEILEKEKETFGRMMSLEMGKPYRAAIDEAAKCALGCRYYAKHGEEFLADEVVTTNAKKATSSTSRWGRSWQ